MASEPETHGGIKDDDFKNLQDLKGQSEKLVVVISLANAPFPYLVNLFAGLCSFNYKITTFRISTLSR
jgi:hypothetical protein